MAGKREPKTKKSRKKSPAPDLKPKGPMHHLVAPLRRFAPVLAWGVSLAAGLAMPERMDLLETVIRSGIVWLLVWILCQVGASLAERLGELTEATPRLSTSKPLESGDATA